MATPGQTSPRGAANVDIRGSEASIGALGSASDAGDEHGTIPILDQVDDSQVTFPDA
jgi:hypothetical protein